MQSINSFQNKLFHINNQNFIEAALELFNFQYHHNRIYRSYVDHLSIDPSNVRTPSQIPYLPIRFFKSQKVTSGEFLPAVIFESSGTTQQNTSRHYINDLDFYHQVSSRIFSDFFGAIKNTVVIGLLPSYLERQNASLVAMVDHFIKISGRSESGFYLDNIDALINQLNKLKKSAIPVFLFGVTFALLDLAKKFGLEMDNLVILETGGMKGRGREMVREELHDELSRTLKSKIISSEYGMTELLSQAYMNVEGYFVTPSWMRVLIRDINDPFDYVKNGKSGAINVIDLANIHSCAFIETEDLGVMTDGGFKVLGRLDNSEMRGCNLLVT